jgi:hypothetical protein
VETSVGRQVAALAELKPVLDEVAALAEWKAVLDKVSWDSRSS